MELDLWEKHNCKTLQGHRKAVWILARKRINVRTAGFVEKASAVCGATVTELDSKEPIARKVGTPSTSRLTWWRFFLRKISLKQSVFYFCGDENYVRVRSSLVVLVLLHSVQWDIQAINLARQTEKQSIFSELRGVSNALKYCIVSWVLDISSQSKLKFRRKR